ncbi:MAG: copper resistance protein CopC [Bowdeniella nasicola]|nr:copper resistance protein CopC [Bowdeniella nasicola]
MPSCQRRWSHRSWVSILTWLIAMVGMFATLGILGAQAHDVLIDSTPSEGQHYDTAPEEISLTFNNELLDLGPGAAAAVLQDGAGNEVAQLPLKLAGRDAVSDVPDLEDGNYRIAWSVVSSDGHRIQGLIHFSVGDVSDQDTTDTAHTAGNPPATVPIWVTTIIGLGIVIMIGIIILKLKRKSS